MSVTRPEHGDEVTPNIELAPGSLAGRTVGVPVHANVTYVIQGITEQLEAAGCKVKAYQPKAPDLENLQDVEVLMTCSALRCDAQLIERLPRLRGIAAVASGTETIDIAAATARALPVAHSPTPENVTSMAEAAVLLILASLYQLPRSQQQLQRGWRDDFRLYARTLHRKTVGLVGFGRIARGVAHRLSAWEVRLITYSPSVPAAELPANVEAVSLMELAQCSDVVSLHGSSSAKTAPLINASFLAALKRGAVLVNTARGALVDEEALLNGLQHGQPAFAAVDCFTEEPLPAHSPLRRTENTLLTPHAVGHTEEVQASLVRQGLFNVRDLLFDARPRYLKNPETLSMRTALHARSVVNPLIQPP